MNIESNEEARPSRPARFPRPARWLNRTVLGVGLASLCSDLSHETVTVLLPGFLASMGASAAVLGVIEGVADGLSSAAKLYGGWLADRVRRRKVVAASGYGVMAMTPLVIAAATAWPVVLAGRALAWVSRGIRTPARKALLADAVTPETYGRAFGLERAMDTCGAIIAPALCYVLLGAGVGARSLVYASAVPAMLAVGAIVLLVRERTDREPVTTPFLRSFSGLGPRYKAFLAAVGLFGIGDFADTFYILYAVAILTPKVGAAQAGGASVALYALHNVLYAGWSYLGGWIADHANRRMLLACGYGCAALAAAFMVLGVEGFPWIMSAPAQAMWPTWTGLALMFALGGSGVGIYEAVEDTIAAELLPREVRGSGFGALAVVTGIGDLVSSLLFGWVWSAAGVSAAAVVAMAPMVAGMAYVIRLARRDGALPKTPASG